MSSFLKHMADVRLSEQQDREAAWWASRDKDLLDMVVDVLVTERASDISSASQLVLNHLTAIPRETIEARVAAFRMVGPW